MEENKIDIVVVSLFDGMSCGRLALDKSPHLNVLRYYSSEVDKYAIQIANKNYPQDKEFRLGDVTQINAKKLLIDIKSEFPSAKILLIGGSPCQGFSLAGKLKGSSTKCGKDVTTLNQYLTLKEMDFEFDGQSYLFWEYIRIKEILMPDYFMLENVRVTKKWLDMFNQAVGVEPVMINSALVSAQNRVRFYWHNFGDILQPEDKGILLKDILESIEINHDSPTILVPEATKKGYIEVNPGECFDNTQPNSKTRRGRSMKDKSNCLLTSNGFTQYIGRPCKIRNFNPKSTCHHIADATDIKGNESIKRVYADSGKSPTVSTCQGGHREPKVLCGASRGRYLVDGVRQDGKMLTAGLTEQMLEVRSDEKTNCLTTVQKDNYIVEGLNPGDRIPIKNVLHKLYNVNPSGKGMNGNVYDIDAKSPTVTTNKGEGSKISEDNGATYRKLTPLECERLQTVNDNYTEGVSNSQRYKMVGNGWTIDVISYIFNFIR